MLFELGMMYSVGRDVPVDLVSAHKWFNLAAVKGNVDAIRLRREVADQMSELEIAALSARRAIGSREPVRRQRPRSRPDAHSGRLVAQDGGEGRDARESERDEKGRPVPPLEAPRSGHIRSSLTG